MINQHTEHQSDAIQGMISYKIVGLEKSAKKHLLKATSKAIHTKYNRVVHALASKPAKSQAGGTLSYADTEELLTRLKTRR